MADPKLTGGPLCSLCGGRLEQLPCRACHAGRGWEPPDWLVVAGPVGFFVALFLVALALVRAAPLFVPGMK